MRRRRTSESEGSRRTDEDGADEGVVEDPSDGYVGDARSTMTVADSSQYGEQSLEEGPVAPHSGDRIQILCGFSKRNAQKKAARTGKRTDTGQLGSITSRVEGILFRLVLRGKKKGRRESRGRDARNGIMRGGGIWLSIGV